MKDFDQLKFPLEFELIIQDMLRFDGYSIEIPDDSQYYDFIASINESNVFVECKFYRSKASNLNLILKSIKLLIENTPFREEGNKARLYISNVFPLGHKHLVKSNLGVEVFDRNDILRILETKSIQLRDRFEKLLLESQQGLDITPPFWNFNIVESSQEESNATDKQTINKETDIPLPKGKTLLNELEKIECGKGQWGAYERKCLDILKFLFEDDLALWNEQNNTQDGLSRFDLICRIASNDDFWRSLVSSFNSRFVLFEFKNYCNEIGPDQIYTTERYLFVKALRSVGFIIARNGGNMKAQQAAMGALKEHGKLIIILSDKDLENMVTLKDIGNSPSDYLAGKLDDLLISLSR